MKNQGLVDVLEGLLQFNPAFRMTARECLKHEMFAELKYQPRNSESNQIEIPLYSDGQYDYQNNIQTGFKYNDLKNLLLLE